MNYENNSLRIPSYNKRKTTPIFRPVTFLVAFGGVLVAPSSDPYVIVDVGPTSLEPVG